MRQVAHKQQFFLICVVLTLATFIAFEPVRHNEFVQYDDHTYVTENPHVTGGITHQSVTWAFTTPYACNWHPLTWLSHMLDCELFGLNPVGHHLTNLLFHIANSLLLFWLLKRMTEAVWRSFFVAAVFALHPLHVESVAWAAERKDVLSGFFWLLTMAAYVEYGRRPGIVKYLLVTLSFCLGLMAKPMLVTLPFVLLVLDYWPLRRFQWQHQIKGKVPPKSQSAGSGGHVTSVWRLLGEKVPLFVLAAFSCVITYLVQQSAGVMEFGSDIPLHLRTMNALSSYVSYIVKMLYPSGLAVLYPYPDTIWFWQSIVCFLLLGGVSAAVVCCGGRRRYLVTGWLWYLGTLVPVIGLVQVGGQSMADRYTYLPSIGFFIIVAWAGSELLVKWRRWKIPMAVSVGLLLLILLLCTRRQVRYWRNSSTLFEHTLAVTENNFVIHNNFGNELLSKGRIDDAIKHYNKSLQINPQYCIAEKNIGVALVRQGKFEEGIRYLEKVLRVKPNWAEAYNSLGLAYARQGRYDLAVQNFEQSLKFKVDYADAHYNAALARAKQERYDDAVRHFEAALQIKPNWSEARNELGGVYYLQGKYEMAIEQLELLAAGYAAEGKFHEAIRITEKAIELAIATGQSKLAEEIEKQLQLYKSGQP